MGNLSSVPRGWPAAVLVLGALVPGIGTFPARAAEAPRHFDIPAEPLGAALNEFARQANVTLLFSSTLVAQARTGGVRGELAVTAALGQLLGGTRLEFRQVSPYAIAIVQSAGSESAASHPLAPSRGGLAGSATPGSSAGGRPGVLHRLAGLLTQAARAFGGGSQNPAAAADAREVPGYNSLREVVVTGTPEVSGVKLLDASFQVSEASLQQIQLAQPSSAADLLKIVPGLWAESSGGETGANIEVAGFPGGADAPYVTYQIEGSPVYPMATLSFMDNSSMFRLDDSIERTEVVQGGPAVVYSNGQIGATANFILRHGTDTPHGELGLTVGDEGLYRLDGFYGGPLARDWFVSLGGFYRVSDGIRSPQFPADDGGQLTLTLFHPMSNGNLLLWARRLRDKNLFITDIPVAVSADGRSISAFPGFNPSTGTFAGNATRDITVGEFPCGTPGCTPGTVSADLADGRGSDLRLMGADLNLELGAWSVSDELGFTAGHMPTNALFNNFAPETMASLMASEIAGANSDAAVMTATGGSPFVTGKPTYVAGGGAVNPATDVASVGFWIVDKKIQALTDDLRFSRSLFAGNTATVGGYFADYSTNDSWYLGNNELMAATPNAQLINLSLLTAAGAAGPFAAVTQNGILTGATTALADHYDGRNAAFFVSDQWHLGPWLLDAEYRIENERIAGAVEGTTYADLDDDPLTFYNNDTNVLTGQWLPSTYDHTLGAWSTGVNYEIDSHMSVYGRINEGVHFPSFDDVREGMATSQQIENYQVGYKAQTNSLYASIDVFHRLFFGVPFQAFLGNGTQAFATYGAASWGTDFQADWFPLERLSLGLTGDWQHSVYTHFSSFAGGGTEAYDYDGNILQRQPRLQVRLTPAYEVPTTWGKFRVFAAVSYIDLRYADPGDTQILPSFTTLDAGIVGDFGDHLEVRLQGTNLTDSLGLTEGNSRSLTAGISTGFEMARPIFGREVQGQVKYYF
jgi:TonB dependent receptor/TonB-dependent Receptor Plug Domain